MKRFLTFAFIAILFFSCKKESQKKTGGDITGKQYPVTFSVANKVAKSAAIAGGKQINDVTPLDSSFKYLSYFVYDNSGSLVHRVVQQSSASDFGSIADYLKAGTYTIVFEAGQGLVRDMGYPQNPFPFAKLANSIIGVYGDDCFYKKLSITVADSAITQSVTLNRLAGRLQIKILDTIPANAAGLNIYMDKEYQDFSFTTDMPVNPICCGLGLIYVNSIKFTPEQIGHAGVTLNVMFVYNVYAPVKVGITPTTVSGTYAPITIDNVSFIRNQTTILSGHVFTGFIGKHNGGFSTSIDPDWGATNSYQF